MRFSVAQIGARRGYAVPALLESAGMLERLYTDACGNVGFGYWMGKLSFGSDSVIRLGNRRVPKELISKTRTFPFHSAAYSCGERISRRTIADRVRANLRWQCKLGRAAARQGFGNATHLFSMLGEFPPLLIAAKERGLKVVSEVYILLQAERILAEERRQFPGWETGIPDFDPIRREFFAEDVLLTKTDYFICPSEAVQEDLVANHDIAKERTAIVPYGMNPRWLELPQMPARGRILFVGTADLRKGIHYLAMAAEELKSRGHNYEFRVAGNVSPTVATQPICRHLNFLGRIPRDRIHEEFQKADVFVLPSLAEGSAEVTYEALASGVPLVTTKAAGSVARDGIDGCIVAERDPEALANAIEQVVEDREDREQMAQAARERARNFTWQRYGERLIAALKAMPV